MKKSIFTSVLVCLFLQFHSQTTCDNATVPSLAPTTLLCNTNFSNYSFTQPLTFKVNIHVFKKTSGSGIYDNIALADAQYLIALVNQKYANLAPNPKIPANPPAPPTPANSNVSFNLTGFYVHIDDDAFTAGKYTDVSFNLKLANVYSVNKYREFNVFFMADPVNYGGATGYSGIVIASHNSIGWGFGSFADNIAHEFGHSLGGLGHPEGTSPGQVPPDVYEPIANPSNALTGPCSQASGITNNLMSNQNYLCKEYLSPMQVACFSVTASGLADITTTGINTSYNSRGFTDYCDYDATKTVVINSNQTWLNSINLRGDLIIQPGVHLIVKCQINFTKFGKLIVKKGAKLTLDGGIMTNRCADLWEGIYIEGDNTLPQTLLSNNMPQFQGMVEIMNSGQIENAGMGITTAYPPSNGGGIIQCTQGSFSGNVTDVQMHNYIYIDPSKPYKKIPDKSFFKNTGFQASPVLVDGSSKLRNFDLYKVRDIVITGCDFNGNSGIEAINCLSGNIIVNDFCTNPPTCSPLKRTSFNSTCDYYIYVGNATNYAHPSVIDHVYFNSNFRKTAVYFNVGNYSSIINCDFTLGNFSAPSTTMFTGLYLQSSMAYVIENNTFFGYNVSPKRTEGIVINGSGPYSNSVYNNRFISLNQGIWAQNRNVNFSNGVGLKMNCNDFQNCEYNIGVQKTGKVLAVNNTGVAFTQGMTSLTNDKVNVRNTYNSSSCSNENKYYINTSNSLNLAHGSFNAFGSYAVNDLHPLPQPGCSTSGEISCIVGIPPTNTNKSAYCPAAFPPSFTNFRLNESATTQRETISHISNALIAKVDGGNTQGLLDIIASNTLSAGDLKNMLANIGPYLSDEVMLAFYDTDPPYGHDKIIHEINAPVSPVVYNKIMSLALPDGVFESIQVNQQQNKLSTRRQLEAELYLARTELGLILNEKILRFQNDSTIDASDSITEVLKTGEIADSDQLQVANYISFGKYDKAEAKLNELRMSRGASQDFIDLYTMVLKLAKDPDYLHLLSADPVKKEELIKWANTFEPLLEGPSRSVLLAAYNYREDEEKLTPVSEGSGSRTAASGSSAQMTESKNGIKIYPNPAQDILYIEMENNNASRMEIRDLTGKLVLSRDIEMSDRINIENLENGIYFVNLVNGNRTLISTKIAIIK